MSHVEGMLGVVVVGGSSRRMGRDKALIEWNGEPMARHVAERLREGCGNVVLVGGAGRGYEHLGLPWWPDPPGLEGTGPLAGLVTALSRAPRVVLCACDLPYLDVDLVKRLIAWAAAAPVAIPVVDGRMEPLLGHYRSAAAGAARASLASGSGRMSDLLTVPGARLIPGEVLGDSQELALCFRNLNSLKDLS